MEHWQATETVERWGVFEVSIRESSKFTNPFTDVKISASFTYQHQTITVDGFYDGEEVYKLRFMPNVEGLWTYVVHSNIPTVDGLTGQFQCLAPRAGNHGPVRIQNRYHFIYEDGTPYLPFGTTCYVWNHQGDDLEETTLKTLADTSFNKMRMCVFPKHYDYNRNEPIYYPFAGSLEQGWDFTRLNPEFFRHLEQRILDLMQLGIEADLILFHPYDRWGYATMDPKTDGFYLRYLIARLAAFRNIWWSLANEYDLMKGKTTADWDRIFRLIQTQDPYHHLRSIHNCRGFYDHGKPWVTHCSVQHSDLTMVSQWLDLYRKPVVVDECGYEGNISHRWGNLTAMDLVAKIWEGTIRCGYVGHGETYVHPQDILWWSKGGVLHGQSAERIAFLRDIVEAGPHGNVQPANLGRDTHAAVGKGNEYFLAYYGASQSAYKDLSLPQDQQYKIEVIDTWAMKITPVEGVFTSNCRVPLPGKPYLALRIWNLQM